jgi:acetate kinase
MSEISAVGHRMVHGGEKFAQSVVIDDENMATFKALSDLAPLHNPPNIMGVEAAKKILPNVKHCAIMDTAWHQTMPKKSYIYALPLDWYDKYGIRRYGFHGTSFLYTSKRAAVLLGKDPFETNLIIAHIGNGASINAVKNGQSYDTSMGFTPLEGLMMGTRCGDIDPAIPLYVMNKEGYTPDEMTKILNKKAGCQGITGKSDRRDIIDAWKDNNDENAHLALEIETQRLKKYIGGYIAELGGVDAIVFTAGVGEFSDDIRGMILDGLEHIGLKYDKEFNHLAGTRNAEVVISTPDSPIKIFVIPTDEERVFIEDVVALDNGTYDIHTKFTYKFQSPDYRNVLRDKEFKKELEENPKLEKIVAKIPQ